MFVDIRMWPIRMIFISSERYGSVDIEYLNPILIVYFDHEVISHFVWVLFSILFIFKFILQIFSSFQFRQVLLYEQFHLFICVFVCVCVC